MAQVVTKGHMDSLCLGCHPCWSRGYGAMLVFEGHVSTRTMQIWVAYVALPQPGSVLMSMVPVNIEGCADAQGMGHH